MTYYTYDFFKYVAPSAHMVPMPVVEDTAADVIIDFCLKTSVYRQWLEDHIYVYEDDEDVEVDLPANTAVVEILAVQEVEESGDYGEFRDPDTYMFSDQDGDSKLLFNDPAEKDYEARIYASLRPTIGFTVVPDWIYENWRDVISEGIKYRLLAMTSKPWFSATEAGKCYANYRAGLQKASARVVMEVINKINKPESRYI